MKKEMFVSPAGIAMWPWLQVPSTQFNPEGDYKVDLKLDPSDSGVGEFLDGLEADVKAHFAELAKKDKTKAGLAKSCRAPFTPDVDRDTGQETGLIVVKFKSGFRPKLFDSKRNPIGDEPKVGSGSKIRVAFTKNFYTAFGGGMNLYLQQVQVINLVEYGDAGTPADGFEEEEGFEADQPAPALKEHGHKAPPADGDEIPMDFDGKKQAAGSERDADPVDALIDGVLAADAKFTESVADAKMDYPEMREVWESVGGNASMFKIRMKTIIKKKGA